MPENQYTLSDKDVKLIRDLVQKSLNTLSYQKIQNSQQDEDFSSPVLFRVKVPTAGILPATDGTTPGDITLSKTECELFTFQMDTSEGDFMNKAVVHGSSIPSKVWVYNASLRGVYASSSTFPLFVEVIRHSSGLLLVHNSPTSYLCKSTSTIASRAFGDNYKIYVGDPGSEVDSGYAIVPLAYNRGPSISTGKFCYLNWVNSHWEITPAECS
jgi:hypothetical protein